MFNKPDVPFREPNPSVPDFLIRSAQNWERHIENRLGIIANLYQGRDINARVPTIADHATFRYVMTQSMSHIYNDVIGPLRMDKHPFRQTPPESALYAAVMVQALCQAEGIPIPKKVIGLGSGDGVLEMAFGLCGFEAQGIEIDEEIYAESIKNMEQLSRMEVKFPQPIEFINSDLHDFIHQEEPVIWVNWPWITEIEDVRKLFTENAAPGSVMASMCMSGDLFTYAEMIENRPTPDYYQRIRPLGTKLNWRQSTSDDFYTLDLEWWGHLGSHSGFDSVNDNWCIVTKFA